MGKCLKLPSKQLKIKKETIFHRKLLFNGGEKLIITGFKCFKNKLSALKKNNVLASNTGIQQVKHSNY